MPERQEQHIKSNLMDHTHYQFAGFWKRFAAAIIDGVLIVFVCSSLKWTLAEALMLKPGFNLDYEESQSIAYILWSVYLILIRWSYYAGMESSPLKATLGKLAVGIYVTDEHGERIAFGQASARFFGKAISGMIFGVGYLMAGFTERKQALQDQISRCFVLKK